MFSVTWGLLVPFIQFSMSLSALLTSLARELPSSFGRNLLARKSIFRGTPLVMDLFSSGSWMADRMCSSALLWCRLGSAIALTGMPCDTDGSFLFMRLAKWFVRGRWPLCCSLLSSLSFLLYSELGTYLSRPSCLTRLSQIISRHVGS